MSFDFNEFFKKPPDEALRRAEEHQVLVEAWARFGEQVSARVKNEEIFNKVVTTSLLKNKDNAGGLKEFATDIRNYLLTGKTPW